MYFLHNYVLSKNIVGPPRHIMSFANADPSFTNWYQMYQYKQILDLLSHLSILFLTVIYSNTSIHYLVPIHNIIK